MLKYIILGIIQGLTEFLPVSSSAHLVIAQHVLGLNDQTQTLVLPIILHLGTSLALIIYFYKDIKKAFHDRSLLLFIITVTFITGIIGLSGKEFFESFFSQLKLVAAALIITGIILILTKRFMRAKRNNVNFKDGVILGITQAIAIIPGISRSGITVSTLLFRGLDKETAFRLSFLASIPAVFGAAMLEVKDIGISLTADYVNLSLGFIFSLFTGIFSLWLLKLVLRKAKLYYFGYYCIIIAIITLVFK